MKCKNCWSQALNDAPETGLCDLCLQKEQVTTLRARVEKLDKTVALAAAYRLAVLRGWPVRKISKALDAALAECEEV